jgi:hypothetical protein
LQKNGITNNRIGAILPIGAKGIIDIIDARQCTALQTLFAALP